MALFEYWRDWPGRVPACGIGDQRGPAHQYLPRPCDVSAKLVFGNNALLHQDVERLPHGVLLKPLEAAAREDEELFRKFFMVQPIELGSHKYASLHQARLSTGAFLYVPKNVEVALPVEIFHWVEGENASIFPHTLVVCGENSKVTVIDHFKSADGKRAFACGVNDLHLLQGRAAELRCHSGMDARVARLPSQFDARRAGRPSTALIMNFGGGYIRGESLSRSTAREREPSCSRSTQWPGDREIDQRTFQDHAAQHATSDLLYLNSLTMTHARSLPASSGSNPARPKPTPTRRCATYAQRRGGSDLDARPRRF